MRRRWPELLCALTVAALIAACGDRAAEFRGNELTGGERAADFTLYDQFGSEVSLSELRGDVVVLTFLYTDCPDICPVVASHLADVRDELSGEPGLMDRVSMVAVSVDPERDTVQRAREYSESYGLLDDWSYLVGDRERLERIWADYYVSPLPVGEEHSDSDPIHQDGSAGSLYERLGAAYTVDHQAPVYLIDRDGTMRVLFSLPFRPGDVAEDVRSLLR
ncbi:MAG: SCO family protein [Dehalococcoidia bacterium]|nr:SCO family protein [Dehalococcoidia bacterium]